MVSHGVDGGGGDAPPRAWVEEGGSYLGLCAGAYYASSTIEFMPGTHMQANSPPPHSPHLPHAPHLPPPRWWSTAP